MTNKRWQRVKRGKFGRVSIVRMDKEYGLWTHQKFFLDGMHQVQVFVRLSRALNEQRKFLSGK